MTSRPSALMLWGSPGLCVPAGPTAGQPVELTNGPAMMSLFVHLKGVNNIRLMGGAQRGSGDHTCPWSKMPAGTRSRRPSHETPSIGFDTKTRVSAATAVRPHYRGACISRTPFVKDLRSQWTVASLNLDEIHCGSVEFRCGREAMTYISTVPAGYEWGRQLACCTDQHPVLGLISRPHDRERLQFKKFRSPRMVGTYVGSRLFLCDIVWQELGRGVGLLSPPSWRRCARSGRGCVCLGPEPPQGCRTTLVQPSSRASKCW